MISPFLIEDFPNFRSLLPEKLPKGEKKEAVHGSQDMWRKEEEKYRRQYLAECQQYLLDTVVPYYPFLQENPHVVSKVAALFYGIAFYDFYFRSSDPSSFLDSHS